MLVVVPILGSDNGTSFPKQVNHISGGHGRYVCLVTLYQSDRHQLHWHSSGMFWVCDMQLTCPSGHRGIRPVGENTRGEAPDKNRLLLDRSIQTRGLHVRLPHA